MTTEQERPEPGAERGVLRRLGGPVVGYFDHRFADLRDEIARRTDALDARLPAPDDIAELRHALAETRAQLEEQRHALHELATSVEHFARTFAERADDIAAAFAQLVERAERVDRGTETS
ncbi:MAG TPA: hypothetical protein VFZ83_00305 [Acidimicrobiia bacterium]|nr:hypothetical protein [Acidimicrobiia bacterium]